MTRKEMRTVLEGYGLVLGTFGDRRKTYEIRKPEPNYPIGRCVFSGSRLEAEAWVKQIQSWAVERGELDAWLDREGRKS